MCQGFWRDAPLASGFVEIEESTQEKVCGPQPVRVWHVTTVLQVVSALMCIPSSLAKEGLFSLLAQYSSKPGSVQVLALCRRGLH